MKEVTYSRESVDNLIGIITVDSYLYTESSLHIGEYNHTCNEDDNLAISILKDMYNIAKENITENFGSLKHNNGYSLQFNSKAKANITLDDNNSSAIISVYKVTSKITKTVVDNI